MPEAFVSALAYQILASREGAMIVTGGFLHKEEKTDTVSTDVAALEGARRFAKDRRIDLKDCYEAWIPEPELDGRTESEGVVRMSESDGITVRVMTGRTALGRRLAMVAGVDMVVTIAGRRHTEVVAEQALELGIPLLPIPDADGDSEKILMNYRERIAASFDPGMLDLCLAKVSQSIHSNPEAAAGAVIELIHTARVGRCLVLMPYDKVHNALYKSSIEPAVSRHMIPLRLDGLPRSGAIYESFAEAVRSSSAVIADITRFNKNVMYEVGYAHGVGLTPLIYTRNPARLQALPVYFRTLNVRPVTETATVDTLIDEYLTSFKATRRVT